MTTSQRPTYRGMRVTGDAHTDLSGLAFVLTGQAGRRVSLSEAITAACLVATRHHGETLAALAELAGPGAAPDHPDHPLTEASS